jgi:DNA-binding LytR/AlgR family response regulator
MKVLKCLIVEDEPIAAGIIEDYIKLVPFLSHELTFHDPVKALHYLSENSLDVIFLDLSMPHLNGKEFLGILTEKYKIILTTAHHEFGIESYEWGVVDYLLKPIPFSRFMIAVNKLKEDSKIVQEATPLLEENPKDRAFKYFNVNKTMIRVFLDEIWMVESIKDYVRINTGPQTIITKGNLQDFETIMQAHGGLRIHRSYLVNLHHVEAFTTHDVIIHGKTIPVGRLYKESVLEVLKGM